MNGDLTVLGEYLLLAIALLFSTTLVTIGRLTSYPASVAAYGTAVAIVVAQPLLSHTT